MAPGSTGPTGTSKPSLLALGPLRNVGISQEPNSNFRPVLECRAFLLNPTFLLRKGTDFCNIPVFPYQIPMFQREPQMNQLNSHEKTKD